MTLSSGQITWSTAKPLLPISGLPSANSGLRTRAMRGRHVEQVVRDLAGHEVGLVQRRAGDQHVGVLGAGLAQHRGLDAVADHAAQVEPVLQRAQARGSVSITVMSFCSETRLSATLSPTRPAPRMRIFMAADYGRRHGLQTRQP